MKKIYVAIVIVIISLLTISILKDSIIRTIVSVAATDVTGAEVKIGGFSLAILGQAVSIKDFKMYNPQGFPKEVFMDVPVISCSYDLGAILKGDLHLRKVELNLKELVVIKDKEGKLNVNALKVAKKDGKEEKPEKQMPMKIDELTLSIGRIISKDYSKGSPPVVAVYDVNIKRSYKNITSAQQMLAIVLAEGLKHTAIQGAKIYAASTILGVGFLPAGVAITVLGKDSTQESFNIDFDKTYATSLSVLTESGQVKQENKSQGIIKALVNSSDITVIVEKLGPKESRISVKARRLLLPKPEIAKGVLLGISEKLK